MKRLLVYWRGGTVVPAYAAIQQHDDEQLAQFVCVCSCPDWQMPEPAVILSPFRVDSPVNSPSRPRACTEAAELSFIVRIII